MRILVGFSTRHTEEVDVNEAELAAWAVRSGVLGRLSASGQRGAPSVSDVTAMMRANHHFASFLAGRFHTSPSRR
ncbi:hypothetical protein CIK75_02780 [Glutamicibacter sp. BW78]|uniref:hypothetical protein n=1 Tax=Glutamicibacter sp. BW78 TaxID=2024403 RepID=UPI000BB85F49|nr:hypothetical protein [Glutamicibacter sp. BW78]PCC26505.1 hypothetical protein CIK75_02780 [Glutamicibacter sp. BW78]